MLSYYVKQTWRSLRKNKLYSALNIAGLVTGLTCFAFIALWVSDELSYDKFNTNYDRIFRVTGSAKTATGIEESAVSSPPMAKALQQDYPEVANTVRFDVNGDGIVQLKDKKILETNMLFTDPSIFDIFSFKLLRGDKSTVLKDPFTIVLTESTAKKYFGDSDPIGQVITMYAYDSTNRGAQYTVTGIAADAPKNSHIQFNILGSFKTVEVVDPSVLTVDGWGDAGYYTYIQLKEGVDHKAFSAKMEKFYGKYIGDLYQVWKNIYSYRLQPLRDIYLRSNLRHRMAATGNITQVYVFSIIGIFILLLAAINYMNLATARSVKRAKEVGIKKVAGALKGQLVIQFLFEAVLTALMALALSLALCYFLQPLFAQLTGKDISPLSSTGLILFLTGIAILLGILSGIYPALVLSLFKPARVLKGSFQTSASGVLLRKTLVTLQFTITLILITCIIVVNAQMSYIKHKDLGYDKDALVLFKINGDTDIIEHYEAFKNELGSNPLISGISVSNSALTSGLSTGGSETVDNNGNPIQVNTSRLRVDENYLATYGISLVAGRNFTALSRRDSVLPIIINEAAVRQFGWQDATAAIGKPFKMGGQQGTVIGVIKNFHFNSLQKAIEPLAMYPLETRFSRITARIDMTKASQSMAWVEKVWKKHFPAALFDYSFYDKYVGNQYQAEERFSRIFLYFSVLSLLIACLGLYGLISFTASQKTKEIGIRKILGARVDGIVFMLSKDFLKLVALAFLIASPVAWYIMQSWLQDFVYRTELSWWMFAVSGTGVLLIALLTVSFQAIKAALANPIKALRSE